MGVRNQSKLRVLALAVIAGVPVAAALHWKDAAEPRRCEGQLYDVMTVPGGRSPYIQLEAGGRHGSFLLDYGSTQSSLSQNAFSTKPGAGDKITLSKFSLPGFKGGSFDVRSYRLTMAPPGGQLGIIGTDFLALLTADFSFRETGYDVVLGAKPCDSNMLRKRGMIGVRQTGFFSSDPSRVEPGRPNVPVLFLDIGGVKTWAQIDTGYDDGNYRPSIDINDALYEQLMAAGVPMHWFGGMSVTTCNGLETREAYEFPDTQITLNTDSGREILKLADAKILRQVANGCGGIANMATPAAQLGASIIARLGNVVFDPKSEMVWALPAEQRTAQH